MNAVKQQCIVGDRGGPWGTGIGFTKSASGADAGSGAGGPAVKASKAVTNDGAVRNKGRANRARSSEVHHNGGTQSIGAGSTNPPR